MPVKTLPELVDRAVRAGLDPQTPAVAVERATRPDEHIVAATIADLPARLAAEPPSGPVVVIIGRVLAEYIESATTKEFTADLAVRDDNERNRLVASSSARR
jgi:uroporphyrin-III C-methyltransferase/precorrin-2 dehydrogenase/sirohydrochlorin ferrochelatase